MSRCILKVFSPEVYTTSFRGDIKVLVPGDLFFFCVCVCVCVCVTPEGFTTMVANEGLEKVRVYLSKQKCA